MRSERGTNEIRNQILEACSPKPSSSHIFSNPFPNNRIQLSVVKQKILGNHAAAAREQGERKGDKGRGRRQKQELQLKLSEEKNIKRE